MKTSKKVVIDEVALITPVEIEDWRGREAKRGAGMNFAMFLVGIAMLMYGTAVTNTPIIGVGLILVIASVMIVVANY